MLSSARCFAWTFGPHRICLYSVRRMRRPGSKPNALSFGKPRACGHCESVPVAVRVHAGDSSSGIQTNIPSSYFERRKRNFQIQVCAQWWPDWAGNVKTPRADVTRNPALTLPRPKTVVPLKGNSRLNFVPNTASPAHNKATFGSNIICWDCKLPLAPPASPFMLPFSACVCLDA